jgi:hypothetical protein
MTNPALASFSDRDLTDEMLARMAEKARAELLALPVDDPDRVRWLNEREEMLNNLRAEGYEA